MKQHNAMQTCLSKQCVFTPKEQKHACYGLSPNTPITHRKENTK